MAWAHLGQRQLARHTRVPAPAPAGGAALESALAAAAKARDELEAHATRVAMMTGSAPSPMEQIAAKMRRATGAYSDVEVRYVIRDSDGKFIEAIEPEAAIKKPTVLRRKSKTTTEG